MKNKFKFYWQQFLDALELYSLLYFILSM